MEDNKYKYAFKKLEDVDDADIYFTANQLVEKLDIDTKSIFTEAVDYNDEFLVEQEEEDLDTLGNFIKDKLPGCKGFDFMFNPSLGKDNG